MALTQKQQLAILAALGGGGAVVALVMFVLVPTLGAWKADKAEVKKLQGERDKMRAELKKRPEIQTQIDAIIKNVRQADHFIPEPVLDNYLLGMEEKIRACGAGLDLQIKSVTDYDQLELPDCSGAFRVYRVRVIGQSGANELARLLLRIEQSNPLVSVSGMNIVPRDDIPDRHDVSFVVSWLIWADPKNKPEFLTLPAEAKEGAPPSGT